MAEQLGLNVELNDKDFENAAKRMQDKLDSVAKTADRLQGKLNFKLDDKIVQRFQAAGVNKIFNSLVNPKPINDGTNSIKQFRTELTQGANAFKTFTHAFDNFSSLGGAVGGLLGGGLGSLLGGGIGSVVDTLIDGAKAFASIIVEGFSDGLKLLAGIEQTNLAYKYVTGGGSVGQNILDDLRNNVSQKSPFNQEETKQIALPLYRTFGNDINAVHRAFGAAADLSVFQGKPTAEQTANNAQTLANIQQRGGISSRQLTSLGLTNESNKVFYENLAKQWNVTPEQAKKLAQQGGHADDVLNELYRSIIRQSKQPLGAAGLDAQQTLASAWHKLLSVPSDVLDDFSSDSERFKGAAQPLTTALLDLGKSLKDQLESPEVMTAIGAALGELGNTVKRLATPESITALTKGFTTIVEGTAWFIKKIGDLGEKIGKMFNYEFTAPKRLEEGQNALLKVEAANNIKSSGFASQDIVPFANKYNPAQRLDLASKALAAGKISQEEFDQFKAEFAPQETSAAQKPKAPTKIDVNPSPNGDGPSIGGGLQLHLAPQFNIPIVIQGSGTPEQNAAAGQAIKDEVKRQLTEVIEQVQQEIGAA